MPAHLEFRDVTVHYGTKKALDEISLSAARHSVLAIVGPANSGKSTLLKTINRTIEFARPGVSLDLGGIAKGHALDCAARVLREVGVTSALLHGGTSSILAIGAPATGNGWRVAVRGRNSDRPVELRDAALSVSDAGGPAGARRRESHIVDPRTGSPVPPAVHATVIGPSARLADAWSTALVVLGRVPAAFPSDYAAFIDVYATTLV